ncbi:MAG: HpcH/HpaI aldolase/citrate lyase family protein [Lachnospiraceae bacterium]|nr:HpcH/HpaI aldolase/citrate lyase family protein [Lachnospiraceae bacterium]
MKNSMLYYSVGALLYCPANNEGIVSSITSEKFGRQFSLALCLEDTIPDQCVLEAEQILISSLHKIYEQSLNESFYLPKIFVRVRRPQQILPLLERLAQTASLLCGFIIPKFSSANAENYIEAMKKANEIAPKQLYMMPIFESPDIVNLNNRYSILYSLKDKLDAVSDLVLNIRVGGNDLCHIFGFRRRSTESIHNLRPIANIFSDIVTVFGMDYVISGPVWEYYNGVNWKEGLAAELEQDRLCGFVGKTVIHPRQIPVVNAAFQVPEDDLKDARAILGWNPDRNALVAGSVKKERMNEYKTHYHWAEKTVMLAEIFGTKH